MSKIYYESSSTNRLPGNEVVPSLLYLAGIAAVLLATLFFY